MYAVAARILVFAVVFLGLNPVTVVVVFGVEFDYAAYAAAAHVLVCFVAGTLLFRSPQGLLWLSRCLLAWLILFAPFLLYVDYALAGLWANDGAWYRTVHGLGALLIGSWWVGRALSHWLTAGRPGFTRRQLRVPLAATLLFAIVAAALQWRGDMYEQALRHYEAGRYEEAVALLKTEVIDKLYIPMTPARHSASWREAFVLLGTMYEAGKGVDPDPAYAFRLYMGAAGNLKWWDVHEVNREEESWRYAGYGPGARAAAEACRLATELREIALYCKGFEHDVNVRALEDPAAATAAADKFRTALRDDDAGVQLLRAASFGRLDVMQDALGRGADVNAVLPDNDVVEIHDGVYDPDSWARDHDLTPLIAAAARHHVDAMALLFEHGADPNFVPADNEQSLLSRVVSNAHLTIWMQDFTTDATVERVARVLETLLENGYEVTDQDLQTLESRHDRDGEPHASHNRRLQRLHDRCRQIIGV